MVLNAGHLAIQSVGVSTGLHVVNLICIAISPHPFSLVESFTSRNALRGNGSVPLFQSIYHIDARIIAAIRSLVVSKQVSDRGQIIKCNSINSFSRQNRSRNLTVFVSRIGRKVFVRCVILQSCGSIGR